MNFDIQLQVAFAGHNRPGDLGDGSELRQRLQAAFELVRSAGIERARLLTGLAPGADRLAAEAWLAAALGPVHGVLPFVPPQAGDPDELTTWLDGEASEAAGRSAHLAQTRWILAQADLLVVVWTGKAARGAGGTADAVRLAIGGGLPVLWIRPGEDGIRLVHPETDLLHEFDFVEWLEGQGAGHMRLVSEATVEGLRDLLPSSAPDTAKERRDNALDRWLHRSLWRTFALFQRTLGGRVPSGSTHLAPPADLAAQPGFGVLSQAYEASDVRATRLAAVHRSEQIILLVAAVTAAVVGSAPSLWPELKFPVVLTELALAVAAFAVAWSAGRARQHERWTEARRQAEQIRLERAAWVLGTSTRGAGSPAMRREHERLGRPILRQAGPPLGRMEGERMARWAAWAMQEVIGTQADYHRHLSLRSGRIAERIRLAEDASFGLLVATLSAFAVAYLVSQRAGNHLPVWISGAVLMLSVVLPAVGAAALALEAKLEFEEQAERSHSLAAQLDEIGGRGGSPVDAEAARGALSTAIEWLLTEADQWRDRAGRRRLFRGG